MDSDPFAVWSDDPLPPPTRTSLKVDKDGEEHRIRAASVDEQGDPGWGAPHSPVKTRQVKAIEAEEAEVKDVQVDAVKQEYAEVEQQVSEEQPGSHDPAEEIQEDQDDQADVEPTPESHESQAPTLPTQASAAPKREPEEAADDSSDQDDDFDQEPAPAAEDSSDLSQAADEDDGFDDFDEPVDAAAGGGAADDDFGDFGDFDDNVVTADGDDFGDEEPSVPAPVVPVMSVRDWTAVDVTPNSTKHDLYEAVQNLLPVSTEAAKQMTGEGLRQVEGMAQVLISEQSRQLWKDLSALPQVKPMDWIRSRTRRDYLITMGVPVNLDEIHNAASGSLASGGSLPPLKLKLNSGVARVAGPSSAPGHGGVRRSASVRHTSTLSHAGINLSLRSASVSGSPRDGSSSPALGQSTNKERMAERRREELGLGPPPEVDLKRAQELVGKTEDQLSLLSLPALRSLLSELNSMTTSTSTLLTHHLTLRESYQADSEMYNSMIKELVTGAASRIGGATSSSSSGAGSLRGGADRRATTIGVGASTIAQNRAVSSRLSSASPSLRGGASSPRR